jgi:hypothetical protein
MKLSCRNNDNILPVKLPKMKMAGKMFMQVFRTERAEAPRTRAGAHLAVKNFFRNVGKDSEACLTPRIHLCDQHQLSLGGWIDALADGVINKGSLLVHADSHDDLGVANDVFIPGSLRSFPSGVTREKLISDGRDFVARLCRTSGDPESSFIAPAIHMGLFDRMVHVYESEKTWIPQEIRLNTRAVLGRTTILNIGIAPRGEGPIGVPLDTVGMASFQTLVAGHTGGSVLDLDLDYFNFAAADPGGAIPKFLQLVAGVLRPSFMTIALSRSWCHFDLSNYPRLISSILDHCFENRILVD